MKFTLKNARLSFDNLFEARDFNGDGKKAWSGNFIIPKDHPQLDDLRKTIRQAANDKWSSKADATLKQLESADKVCLHDGDTKPDYDGYEGNLFISARTTKARPKVVDRDPKVELTEADGKIYAGCVCNVVFDIYAQDNAFGKRINAGLMGVQFVKDADAFGGGRPANEQDFETLSGGDAEDFI